MLFLKLFGICIFTILAITGITQRDAIGGENNLTLGVVSGIIVLLLLCSIYASRQKKISMQKKMTQNQVDAEKEAQEQKLRQEELLSKIDSNTLAPIYCPKIILNVNEHAYWEDAAILLVTKNKLVGTKGRNGGVSMRMAKGLYLRSSQSGSQKIYEDVTDKFSGTLSVTDQRITFFHPQKAFEIPLHKLTNICLNADQISFQQSNKTYTLQIADANIINHLVRKLCLRP